MRYFPLLLLLALFFTACTPEKMEEKEIEIEKIIDADAEPGMMHSVYFWLKDDVDEAGRKAFTQAAMELEAVPSAMRVFVGPPAPVEEPGITDNTFATALIVWFKDEAAYTAYQTDPLHVKFVEENKDKFATVKVFDNLLK